MRDRSTVFAARAGGSEALDVLVRQHLPLVYNLVRRALNAGPDVDDVVQDIMLRALRQLPELRDPSSFRPWLTAIAIRQISTHLARNEAAARRAASLDEVIGSPDAGAELEGAVLLRAELAAQRRQVMHAARWLAADDRALLPLWWLETLGELSRAEVAASLGVPVAHAGVRMQRMRGQLELSRSIVAALEAVPGCDALAEVIADWDGTPSPFWRKRLARHTRTCPVCAPAAEGLLPTDRLLAGLLLLPVPAALTAALLGKHLFAGTAGAVAAKGWLAGIHPVAATVLVGSLAVGTVTWTVWPDPAPAVITAPRPPGTGVQTPPGALPLGRLSLESANVPGRFVSAGNLPGTLQPLTPDSAAPARKAATFETIRGLADPDCYSFRAADGRYLRHLSFRLRLSPEEGTVLFRRDATFCGRAGSGPESVALESHNFTGFYLRHLGDQLWVDQSDGSAGFRADSSFVVRSPLG
jgi:RNA polymerase sigma factor (sigma-70 family)